MVTALASSPGARSVTGLTSENSLADAVASASAPSTVYASNMGEVGPPPTRFWCTWSGTEIASNPGFFRGPRRLGHAGRTPPPRHQRCRKTQSECHA